MYGDIRHLYVMQSEAENEIDFEDIRHSADKYSKAFNEHNRRQGKAVRKSKTTTTKSGERKTYRNGDMSEPHFRPAQRPAAFNSKQRTKPTKTAEKNSLIDNLINSNVDASADKMKSKSPDNTSDVSSKTTKLISITTTSLSTTPNSLKSISEASSNDDNDDRMPTKEESDRKKNETIDKAVLDLFGNISASSTGATVSSSSATSALEASEENEEVSITERNVQLDVNAEQEEVILDVELITEDSNDESDVLVSATSTSKEPLMTTTTEAQLFQDSVVIPTPINRRGV
jgi:hypothetical protein